MHITVDCRFVNHSGIGRYIVEIVNRLVKNQDNKYTLIVSRNEINKRFMQECMLDNVNNIYCSAPMYSIREQLEMPFIIPKCDIFWAPHYNAPIFPIRAKKKIVTIHDMGHIVLANDFSFVKKIYARLLFYISTHYYDQVFTDSFFSKKEIQKYENIPEKKIAVQYCAVDLAHYRNISDVAALQKISEKYKLPQRYFLYVGNVKPHKNIVRLIKAYAHFYSKMKEKISLVIVGKKDGLLIGVPGLADTIENLGIKEQVVFTGFVDDLDLPRLYSMAELFLFPSLYEGFGIPPLEAMACECPVIVSNAASMPEVCGDAAMYVDPYDEADIAAAMVKLFTDQNIRNRLICSGTIQVKKYAWDKTVQDIENIFAVM